MAKSVAPAAPLDADPNLALEALLALLVVAPFVVLAAVYDRIPDPVPIHWNAHGEVDGWAAKSVVSVFVVPVLGLYMQGLFVLLERGMRDVRLTPPDQFAEQWLRLKSAQVRANIRLLDVIRIADAILIAGISWAIASAAIPDYRGYMSVGIAVSGAAGALLVVGLVYGVIKLFRIKRELADLPAPARTPPDPANYRWGGAFYYNPDDPSLFVEKRYGVGYTFNMANRRVWWYVGYILGLPFLVFVAIAVAR
jgi:uncharacterized membrane protein